MRKKPFAVLAAAAMASLSLAACGSGTQTGTAANAPAAAPAGQLTPVTQATTTSTTPLSGTLQQSGLAFGVSATGEVAANQDADLVFQVNGSVGRVLIQEGDKVKKGDLLAELDVRSLDQDVRNAEAALVSARADQSALTEDPKPEDAAAAQAQISQAQGQLAQTQGSVTPQDVAAAQASLEQAQANLADVQAGPKTEEVQRSTAQRDAAAAQLQQSRNSLSQAKTQAELGVQQATTSLKTAQVEYSQAYWDWKYVQDKGRQPSDVEQRSNPELSDSGTQKIYNAFKQAELQLQQAQEKLTSAEKQLEDAKQAEIDGINTAQANVQAAQASLDLLVRPPDADDVAQAQAQVATAQANLEKLQGGERAGQLEAARASVQQAQARYDQLYSDPTASEQAKAEANVARAEASLAQAKLNREYGEIRAPFDGEIAVRNIDPGDTAPVNSSGGQPAIRLVDTSKLYIEVQASDADIARVKLGQKASITADALPGQVYTGTVSFVSPTANVQQNVTTYLVKIQLDEANTPLRVGMSVTADIQTDQK